MAPDGHAGSAVQYRIKLGEKGIAVKAQGMRTYREPKKQKDAIVGEVNPFALQDQISQDNSSIDPNSSHLSIRQCYKSNNLNLERRSSEMLSEPVMNYDLPLSSSRLHVTRVSIPDCGNQGGPSTFSNPITQSQSQTTTAAKNTPMNSLQNTIKSKVPVVPVGGIAQVRRFGEDVSPRKQQMQRMQQSLYVGLGCREIDDDDTFDTRKDEQNEPPEEEEVYMQEIQEEVNEETQMTVGDYNAQEEIGSGLGGRFDTETMEQCIKKVNQEEQINQNSDYNSQPQPQKQGFHEHTRESRLDPSSRRDQLSSERLDTHYFKENRVPTQQSLGKHDTINGRNQTIEIEEAEEGNGTESLRYPLFIQNANISGSGAIIYNQPSQEERSASACVTSASQKVRHTIKSSDFSSINENYQFLAGVQEIDSNPRQSDYVTSQDKKPKKRSRFVSLDGPGQSVKIPSLPSESTQGLSNLLNSQGQIILSATNNKQFMLVPIQNNSSAVSKQPDLSPINKNNKDYHDQSGKFIKNGTASSNQSKGANGSQQYQMISFGPEEGQMFRLHSQSTPRMKFTQNSAGSSLPNSSSQHALRSMLLSKQKLNQVQHLGEHGQGGAVLDSANGGSSGCISLEEIAQKLCARVAAKELCLGAEQVLNFLDIQNQQLSIVLNQNNDIDSKLQQLVEALNCNNNRSQQLASELPNRIKGKNNLEIMQEIKDTFQRIIDVQLSISQKDNIYLKYAGEVERNQMLREELESHDLLIQTKDKEIEQLVQDMSRMQNKMSINVDDTYELSDQKADHDGQNPQLNRSRSLPPQQYLVQPNCVDQSRVDSARYVLTSCSHRGKVDRAKAVIKVDEGQINWKGGRIGQTNKGQRLQGGEQSNVSSLSATKMFKNTKTERQLHGQESQLQNILSSLVGVQQRQSEPSLPRKQPFHSQAFDLMPNPQTFNKGSDTSGKIPQQFQELLAAKDKQISLLLTNIDQLRSDQGTSSNNHDLQERLLSHLGSIERKVESLARSQVLQHVQDGQEEWYDEAYDDGKANQWEGTGQSGSTTEGDLRREQDSSQMSETSDKDSDIVSKCVDIQLPQPTDLDEEPQLNQQYLRNSNQLHQPSDSSPEYQESQRRYVFHDMGQPIDLKAVQAPKEQYLSFQSNLSRLTGPYIQSTNDAQNSRRNHATAGMSKQIGELQDQVKSLVGIVKDLQQQLQNNQASERSRGATLLQHGGRTAQFNVINTKSSPSDNIQSSRSSNKLEQTFQLKKRSQSQLTQCSSKPSVMQQNYLKKEESPSAVVSQPYTARPEKVAHRHHISHDQLTPFQTHRPPNEGRVQSTHTTSISDGYLRKYEINTSSPAPEAQVPNNSLSISTHLPILPFHVSMPSPTKPSACSNAPMPIQNVPVPQPQPQLASSLSATLLQQEIARMRQSHLQTVDSLQKKHKENIQKLSRVIKVLEGRLTQMNSLVTDQKQNALSQMQKNESLVQQLRSEIEQKSNLLRDQTKDLECMKDELARIRKDNSERRQYLRQVEEDMQEKDRGIKEENQKQEEAKMSLLNSLKEQDMARKIDSEIWSVEKRQLIDQIDDLKRKVKDEEKLHRKALRENQDLRSESQRILDNKDGELLKMRDQMLSLQIEMKTLEKQTQYDIQVREEAWKADMQKLKSKQLLVNTCTTTPIGTMQGSLDQYQFTQSKVVATAPTYTNQALQATVLSAFQTLQQTYTDLGAAVNEICMKFQDKKTEQRLLEMVRRSKQAEAMREKERERWMDEMQKTRLKVMEYKQLASQMKMVIGQKDVLIRRMKEMQEQSQQVGMRSNQELKMRPGNGNSHFDSTPTFCIEDHKGTMPSFRMLSGRNQSWTRGVPSGAMTSTVSDCSFDPPLFNLVSQLKSGQKNLSNILEKKNQDIEKMREELERKTGDQEKLSKKNQELAGKIEKLEADKGGLMKTVDGILAVFSQYDLSAILELKVIPNDLNQRIQLLIESYSELTTKLSASKFEVRDLQDKVQQQRKLLQDQIDTLEKEMNLQSERHIKVQEESSMENCRREKELEEELKQRKEELERVRKELEYMERQENKYDKQRKYEQERIIDLEKQIEYLKRDHQAVNEKFDREKNLNMDLSLRIKKMEDAIDKKVTIIDKLQSENVELGKTRKENEEMRLMVMKYEGEIKLLQEQRLSRIGLTSVALSTTEQSYQKRPSISMNINSDLQMEQMIRDNSRSAESFHGNQNNPILIQGKQLHGSSISSTIERSSSTVGGLSQSEQISHLIAQIRYQDRKLSEMESKLAQVKEFEAQIKQLKDEKQELIEKLSSMEHEMLVLKDQNYQQKIDIQQYKESVEYFEHRQSEDQRRIEELNENLSQNQQQLQALQHALKTTADDVRAAVNEAQTHSHSTEGDTVPQSDRSTEKKLRKEIMILSKKLEDAKLIKREYKNEVRTSREVIIRYKKELANLQKEKKDLLKQINQMSAQLRAKPSLFEGEMPEYNLSYTNTDPYTNTTRNKSEPNSGQFKQVVVEKDKYISKVEEENGRLRLENEELKDKVIKLEIENIGKIK